MSTTKKAAAWRSIGLFLAAAVVLSAAAWSKNSVRSSPAFSTTPKPAAIGDRASSRQHVAATVHYDLLAKLLADDRRSRPAGLWLAQLADPVATPRIESQDHNLLNRAAPDIDLPAATGENWRFADRSGGPVVLVFYLGYYCNACVHTLFELNADVERFRSLKAEVIAVSGDAPEVTRQRFEQYGRFDFAVLSDSDHALAQAYGTYRPATAAEPEELLHGTFVIERDGTVAWAYRGDVPLSDNLALLYEVARIENRLPAQEGVSSAAAVQAAAP